MDSIYEISFSQNDKLRLYVESISDEDNPLSCDPFAIIAALEEEHGCPIAFAK